MYETEVNGHVESADQIPAAIRQRFDDLAGRVTSRSVLPWGEHCTECVWPTCYTTCDLYSPRTDGKCRRFVDGMVRLDAPQTANGYILKIAFKQWGKLWAPGSVYLMPKADARSLEQRDRRLGQTLYQIGMPAPIKRFAMWRRYDYKKKKAQARPASAPLPEYFVVECHNPNAAAIALSLTMRPDDPSHPLPFQTLLTAAPGYSRFAVPMADITRVLDVHAPFSIELIPNNVPDGTILYFGMLDFATGTALAPESATSAPARNGKTPAAAGDGKAKVKTYKCVVWDLDNTMWDGILVEDGAAALTLKPGITEIIQQLDQRGILHSVASKNDAPEALTVLGAVRASASTSSYPDNLLGPKSEAIKRIAQQLNIGVDALFRGRLDFELAQVAAGCPGVRTLNANAYLSIPTLPECQVPVTAEASERRKMYQTESVRQTVAGRFGEDYLAFLRDCHLEAHLRPLTPGNVQRVHELTQRTNQMNFSGNRYDRAVLERILATPYLDTYVLDCRDRFGDYGVVGFCIVDRREPRITDLAFSCRVQSKRVEHALLSYIVKRYRDPVVRDVFANYRKTSRNAPSGRVFDDVGFELAGETDAGSSLIFPRRQDVPDDGIIEVIYHPAAASPDGPPGVTSPESHGHHSRLAQESVLQRRLSRVPKTRRARRGAADGHVHVRRLSALRVRCGRSHTARFRRPRHLLRSGRLDGRWPAVQRPVSDRRPARSAPGWPRARNAHLQPRVVLLLLDRRVRGGDRQGTRGAAAGCRPRRVGEFCVSIRRRDPRREESGGAPLHELPRHDRRLQRARSRPQLPPRKSPLQRRRPLPAHRDLDRRRRTARPMAHLLHARRAGQPIALRVHAAVLRRRGALRRRRGDAHPDDRRGACRDPRGPAGARRDDVTPPSGMPPSASRRAEPPATGSAQRARITSIYIGLVAANLAAWGWALAAFHHYPVLLGTALLAYGLGLRHAIDADHIAAIDNVTRKLMQQGERPVSVGLFFSLGHSTVVVLASVAIGATADRVQPAVQRRCATSGASSAPPCPRCSSWPSRSSI